MELQACKGLGFYYKHSKEWKCDRCGRTENPYLLKLKPEKFRNKNLAKEYHVVCEACARKLQASKQYNFGNYWKKLWNYQDVK
ncbi:MAG: hypothetical protein ACQERX_05250 [Bacillota bacterium]